MSLLLAPGVMFDEANHKYFYKGRQLSGVTGLISGRLGLHYDNAFVSEHAEEGVHVHKAVQEFINTGNTGSVHPSVRWLIARWHNADVVVSARDHLKAQKHSEVLVSDFRQYASAVDIVEEWPDGKLRIFDIKNGVFKRGYVTWQLSIYKYFIETATNRIKHPILHYNVEECLCISMRDQDVYKIFPKPAEEVEKLLYGAAVVGSVVA